MASAATAATADEIELARELRQQANANASSFAPTVTRFAAVKGAVAALFISVVTSVANKIPLNHVLAKITHPRPPIEGSESEEERKQHDVLNLTLLALNANEKLATAQSSPKTKAFMEAAVKTSPLYIQPEIIKQLATDTNAGFGTSQPAETAIFLQVLAGQVRFL